MNYDTYNWHDCLFPYEYCKRLYEFLKGKKFNHALEIGFDVGCSALVFLAAQPEATLTSVDVRPMSELATGIDLLRKHEFIKDEVIGRFELIQSDSHAWMKEEIRKGSKFDYIYVDGDHSYFFVKQDLLDAVQLLLPGGIIVADDANMPDVAQAIAEIKAQGWKAEPIPGHINGAAVITHI